MDPKEIITNFKTILGENKALKYALIAFGSILVLGVGIFISSLFFGGDDKGIKLSPEDKKVMKSMPKDDAPVRLPADLEKTQLPANAGSVPLPSDANAIQVPGMQAPTTQNSAGQFPAQQNAPGIPSTLAPSQPATPVPPEVKKEEPKKKEDLKARKDKKAETKEPSVLDKVTIENPPSSSEIYSLKQEKDRLTVMAEIVELENKIIEGKTKKKYIQKGVDEKTGTSKKKLSDSTAVAPELVSGIHSNLQKNVESELNKLKTGAGAGVEAPKFKPAQFRLVGVLMPDKALVKDSGGMVTQVVVGEEFDDKVLKSVRTNSAVFVDKIGNNEIIYIQ